MKHRGSKDKNHDVICAMFRAMGCSVAELHNAGLPGWPDIVIGCIGLNHLVEIKNLETGYGRAGLNESQDAFARDWTGGKVMVVTSTDDAVALVTQWRRKARVAP